jgi:hypothetical protein
MFRIDHTEKLFIHWVKSGYMRRVQLEYQAPKMKKLFHITSDTCLLRRRRISVYVVQEQNVDQLKVGDPEQCVSSVRRVFTNGAPPEDVCFAEPKCTK